MEDLFKPNKELPRKPALMQGFYGMRHEVCAICGEHIARVYNYCPNCGQKIDWAE